MTKNLDNLLEKFISGKRISPREFDLLESLFDDSGNEQEIYHWLLSKWKNSNEESVNLQFEQLRTKIRKESSRLRYKKLVSFVSKAAAILFIPLLVSALYLFLNRTDQTVSSELLTLSTQRGEQTSVILPDGTKVWLNVDTKLSYPVSYGIKSRKVALEGEAYFEVTKNPELPFEVVSGNITTKALGTSFSISSYPEYNKIKSSLMEGSVEVSCGDCVRRLSPGQQLIYDKVRSNSLVQSYDVEDELSWKNNQLIFRLMPFDQVIEELEKWYDVDIKYDPSKFKSETFTAKFKQSETLEQVLQIMAKAGEFKYKTQGKTIVIIKK